MKLKGEFVYYLQMLPCNYSSFSSHRKSKSPLKGPNLSTYTHFQKQLRSGKNVTWQASFFSTQAVTTVFRLHSFY